jgi:hypothetical protein
VLVKLEHQQTCDFVNTQDTSKQITQSQHTDNNDLPNVCSLDAGHARSEETHREPKKKLNQIGTHLIIPYLEIISCSCSVQQAT